MGENKLSIKPWFFRQLKNA